MKSFEERNPLIIGAIGVTLFVLLVTAALQYQRLPWFAGKAYSAYFSESGGLMSDSSVYVLGKRVGKVSGIDLDGAQVMVRFSIDKNIRLGDRTEAAIKTESLLGSKFIELTSRGEGSLNGPIPLARTTSPYQLPDALGDLSAAVEGLSTDQLSDSLATLSQTFADTPPDLRLAVQGVERFSQTLNKRDNELRNMLANAAKTTGVLAERTDKIVNLVGETNALLAQLRSQEAALDQISRHISAVSRQITGFITENKGSMHTALEKLNGVLAVVDNRKEQVQKAVKLANQYATSLGESVASGPFFKAYLANLLPGQFVQPFVDAAFSDLGLDPNVLLPSQRSDPQVGQTATPALPVPFPRTGQAGDPKLTVPEAITGNPDDPRYPYREPIPAPQPGGPPPGPPDPPMGASAPSQPAPSPVLEPAPGESTSSHGGES